MLDMDLIEGTAVFTNATQLKGKTSEMEGQSERLRRYQLTKDMCIWPGESAFYLELMHSNFERQWIFSK